MSLDLNKAPQIRVITTPADTNPSGDIFGGWTLSQMDIAGGMVAARLAKGHVMTVAVEAMRFHLPIHVGDEVSCYADIQRIGNTSIAIKVDVWVRRLYTDEVLKVAEGTYTYVAVDDTGRPRPVPPS